MDEKPLYREGGGVMGKATKVWLITAAALVLIGCILFAGVMLTIGGGFFSAFNGQIRNKYA